MSDIDRAIAAAREAYIAEGAKFVELDDKADPLFRPLGDLLAALDAARGQAVAWGRRDEDGDISDCVSASHLEYPKGTPTYTVPLFAAPPAAAVSDAALDAAVKGWTLDGGIGLRDALRGAIKRALLASNKENSRG